MLPLTPNTKMIFLANVLFLGNKILPKDLWVVKLLEFRCTPGSNPAVGGFGFSEMYISRLQKVVIIVDGFYTLYCETVNAFAFRDPKRCGVESRHCRRQGTKMRPLEGKTNNKYEVFFFFYIFRLEILCL